MSLITVIASQGQYNIDSPRALCIMNLLSVKRISSMRRSRDRNIDHIIPSPCRKVCQLADDQPICKGCFRHQDEIRDWIIMDRQTKIDTLKQALARKQDIRNLAHNK